MQERDVKCILDTFQDHTAGEDEDRHIQVAEWINGEGIDVHFKDGQHISLSWSQYKILKQIVNNKFLDTNEQEGTLSRRNYMSS